jgi:hypothetical protein
MQPSASEVACILFNDAFTEYYKATEGSVLCIADAKPLPADKGHSGLALSVNSAKQIIMLGHALHFGYCSVLSYHTTSIIPISYHLNNIPYQLLLFVYECYCDIMYLCYVYDML